jgi:hypothetical protein
MAPGLAQQSFDLIAPNRTVDKTLGNIDTKAAAGCAEQQTELKMHRAKFSSAPEHERKAASTVQPPNSPAAAHWFQSTRLLTDAGL